MFAEGRCLGIGSKRDEGTGEWRTLQNEKLHDLYTSPNIIPVIKSRIMKWVSVFSPLDFYLWGYLNPILFSPS
jgi:hypothetical protein